MNILEEKKLVTIGATAQEMDVINDIDIAVIAEYTTIIDLDTYAEYVEENIEILDRIIEKLSENGVEADMLQFCIQE